MGSSPLTEIIISSKVGEGGGGGGEIIVCVDGELRENHSQKLVCNMRKRNSQSNLSTSQWS